MQETLKNIDTSTLVMKWVNFQEYKEEIYDLRKAVFIEDQGYEDFMLYSEHDENALHLVIENEGKLIAALAGFIYLPDSDTSSKIGLPSANTPVFQFSKRVTLKEYRNLRISELLAFVMSKKINDLLDYAYFSLGLIGIHRRLAPIYKKTFGFEYHHSYDTSNGEIDMLIVSKEEHSKFYNGIRSKIEILSSYLKIEEPSLLNHIQSREDLKDFYKETSNANLYLAPLSFRDELPRLSAQARLTYATQVNIIDQIEIPEAPAKLLDVGCGPGVYLNLLSKHSKFAKYEFYGMDLSQEMITYAQLSFRKTKWVQGNIYETPYEDNTFDIIHLSYVFIHLTRPETALMELNRILKPGGKIYVVDVNDDTFEGPSVIKRMIHKHKQLYEGNRDIMNYLGSLAEKHGFVKSQEFKIIAENSGTEEGPQIEGYSLKLGRMNMWAMFAFIGQRKDVQSYFQKAESHYFHSQCTISIELQSLVLTKKI